MRDEIKIYQDGRYVSASEASHRLYGFDLHKEHPNVVWFAVHLKGHQTILFQEGTDAAAVLNRNPHTTLTAWFAFNKTTREHLNPSTPLRLAFNTLYHDFPRIATWKKKEKQWALRTQTPSLVPVGRMYFVQPSEGERYFLRLLLHHVPGATSFENLACTNKHLQHPTQHASFKEACQQCGLLQDDAEWAQCMEEVASMASASCLRALFAALLVFNVVANPLALWERFNEDMAETSCIKHARLVLSSARVWFCMLACLAVLHGHGLHVVQRSMLTMSCVCSYNMQGEPTRQLDVAIRDMVLRELALHLAHLNSSQGLAAFGLLTPATQLANVVVANEIAKYDTTTQGAMRNERVPQLNPEQRAVYDNVMVAIDRRAFFVDGLGGTGKTFLYSCLLSTVRAHSRVAIAVASSGITALLLEGGHTAHSRFKIPVQGLNSTSTCYIGRDSELATLLQVATLIVWDEAVMMHRHVFEVVNRSLQDIMAVINPTFKFLPFSGLVVVFGGDFRQILPIVPRGTRGDVVLAAFNHSSIWQHVRVFKLYTNMRVQRLLAQGGAHAQADATGLQAFADYLQRVGEAVERMYPSVGEDSILIPHDMCCNGPIVADLIEEVYGALSSIVEYAARSAYIIERAILTPLNKDVDAFNKFINDKYAFIKHDGSPAQHRVYYNADSVVHGEQHGIYPTEFLNTLSFSGVPPHELHLQEGCPIILLRNMTNNLANGTKLIVIQLMQHVIEAKVATGPAKGQRVFIPWLSITPSDTERMSFTLRRHQFPVRPAFAMTINKAQGQTLKMVDIFLPKPVFTHGQLYVAMSRIGCPEGVKLLITDGWEDAHEDAPVDVYTRNVVYTEVL
jgi:hypothetical protein